MIQIADRMIKILPPVKGKSPGVACVIGLLAGGIGLAIYFRNIVDAVLPLGLFIVLIAVNDAILGLGSIAGMIFAALYGYYRVHLSNTQQPTEPAEAR